jgi:hypothetical protein
VFALRRMGAAYGGYVSQRVRPEAPDGAAGWEAPRWEVEAMKVGGSSAPSVTCGC